ncbi:unnamed protein product [Urochloa humidicola]
MDTEDISKRIKVEGATSSSGGCPPLPEEILEDILSRLPAKSLYHLRCASNSFHAMISSPAFQDAHYHHHNSGGGRLRRLFMRPRGFQEPFYSRHLAAVVDPAKTIIMSARCLP